MADFTVDDLAEMMALLDKDGNQDVSKDEFKEYCERAMGIASAAFEKMWKMIDNGACRKGCESHCWARRRILQWSVRLRTGSKPKCPN